ncbi:unnamed protein product [Linum tenue]|uniref:Homeobox-leucine zipper protein n=1 Tax=Linum tenue TaxID=586396 RepID=A0AAV0PFR1_9ROSI|nr:unnamed protein product [Linum tenue]
MKNKNKDKNKNRKRFSDEQIKSLESIFQSESRLEPRRKVQVAKELGLQPRQVAIWFQNKRARRKSKQLERDYNILGASYTALASRFESLKKEKQALALKVEKITRIQLQTLKAEECEGVPAAAAAATNSSETIKTKPKSRPRILIQGSGEGLGFMSDEYLGMEEADEEAAKLMSDMVEDGGCDGSQEDWGCLDSDGVLFDQPSSDCQWWDFWA